MLPEWVGSFRLRKPYEEKTLVETVTEAIGDEDGNVTAARWYSKGFDEVLASYDFFGLENYSIRMILRPTEDPIDESELTEEEVKLGLPMFAYGFDIDIVSVIHGEEDDVLETFDAWLYYRTPVKTVQVTEIESWFVRWAEKSIGEFIRQTPEELVSDKVGRFW